MFKDKVRTFFGRFSSGRAQPQSIPRGRPDMVAGDYEFYTGEYPPLDHTDLAAHNLKRGEENGNANTGNPETHAARAFGIEAPQRPTRPGSEAR